MDEFAEFIDQIGEMLSAYAEAMYDTADYLDSINFSNTLVSDFFGYFHWALGSFLYTTFVSLALIAVGIQLWKTAVDGIGRLKNFLPW